MAIAAAHDLKTMQFDAINAFTNSDLDKIVYIKFPNRFGTISICLLLLKALYIKKIPFTVVVGVLLYTNPIKS